MPDLASWPPKGSIPDKPLSDEPFRVPSYNVCLTKYATQDWKDYGSIDPERGKKTKRYIFDVASIPY